MHSSRVIGDGLGYDIQSFRADGSDLYIEVKTTSLGKNSSFYISPNEIKFSAAFASNYQLARVYNYDPATGDGEYYTLDGDLSSQIDLKPTQYMAQPK